MALTMSERRLHVFSLLRAVRLVMANRGMQLVEDCWWFMLDDSAMVDASLSASFGFLLLFVWRCSAMVLCLGFSYGMLIIWAMGMIPGILLSVMNIDGSVEIVGIINSLH
jgi:hypothetical protein